ncbi:IclR family transcriptional regulator [Pseudonocardia sp. WMMC193]|uniref:IclR family transcriptional regulator n=1 Tax=Pseudonocardia sp. WMMC193 TaxID=2911965 RepID=UPI001F1940E2|nr:IclR family transcriptional regulator [Pseudonocardia sp. WMMC193]MCF7550869.1 IclR family transcriptional regulator [Pseudonocardia sp. WMMC193]
MVDTAYVLSDRRAADIPSQGTGLQSVSAALDVLDMFLAGSEDLGVSEVSRRLGVAKSSAHRLLTTLRDHGYVVQTEDSRYRLGLHLFELGTAARERSQLVRAASGVLEDLRDRTGRTVHLAVPDGACVVYLERQQAVAVVPILKGIPRRLPVHCSASGKVVAAFDERVAAARRQGGFAAMTGASIRSAEQFDRELAAVRARGFAVNRGEARVGAASVAVPLRDGSGRGVGALSLVTTTEDLNRALERYLRLLASASRTIECGAGLR